MFFCFFLFFFFFFLKKNLFIFNLIGEWLSLCSCSENVMSWSSCDGFWRSASSSWKCESVHSSNWLQGVHDMINPLSYKRPVRWWDIDLRIRKEGDRKQFLWIVFDSNCSAFIILQSKKKHYSRCGHTTVLGFFFFLNNVFWEITNYASMIYRKKG